MEQGNNGQSYPEHFLNHFMCRVENSKPQSKSGAVSSAKMSASDLKEQAIKGKTRDYSLEETVQRKPQKYQNPNRRSGGDADSILHDSQAKSQLSSEFYRQHYIGDNHNLTNELPQALAPTMPTNAYNNYQTTSVTEDGHDNHRNRGADSDRVLRSPLYNPPQSTESYRQRDTSDKYSLKQKHYYPKPSAAAMPTNTRSYTMNPIVDKRSYNRYRNELDSNSGGISNDSEQSARSQKSSKTVISRRSAHDLRKTIVSQCKLHDVINRQIEEINSAKLDENFDINPCGFNKQLPAQCPIALSACKRCNECIHTPAHSQKDVTTEIDKRDFLECHNTDTLTINVDDVVNSKVINPMVRKLQRMFLNTLKEDMSLMEDLERLPNKVNEVYKATIFKQKD